VQQSLNSDGHEFGHLWQHCLPRRETDSEADKDGKPSNRHQLRRLIATSLLTFLQAEYRELVWQRQRPRHVNLF